MRTRWAARAQYFMMSTTSIMLLGTHDLLIVNPAGTNGCAPVSLAFQDLKMLACVYLTGGIGTHYRIDAAPYLAPTNWTTVTNLTVTTQPFIYVDYTSGTNRMQFYRAVPQ